MKYTLLKDIGASETFDSDNIISITANGSTLFIKVGDYKTLTGIKIIPYNN